MVPFPLYFYIVILPVKLLPVPWWQRLLHVLYLRSKLGWKHYSLIKRKPLKDSPFTLFKCVKENPFGQSTVICIWLTEFIKAETSSIIIQQQLIPTKYPHWPALVAICTLFGFRYTLTLYKEPQNVPLSHKGGFLISSDYTELVGYTGKQLVNKMFQAVQCLLPLTLDLVSCTDIRLSNPTKKWLMSKVCEHLKG